MLQYPWLLSNNPGVLDLRTQVNSMRASHCHSELEMNLVIRGTASYMLGARRYDLRPRALVWLFPAQEHILLAQSPDLEMWLGVFSPGLLEAACRLPETQVLLASDPVGHFCRILPEDSAQRLEQLFRMLGSAQGDTRRAGLAYAALAAWETFERSDDTPSGTDIHPAVEHAARLIRDETQAMLLPELAGRVGLSPAYLSALFKAQVGMTVTDFRARQNLQRWLRIYGSGQRISMLEASLEAGFGSYAQFHRLFRELMGCSPAAYRRRMKSGSTLLRPTEA